MLESEIIAIEVHLPGSANKLAENLRMAKGERLLDDGNLEAYARFLKRELGSRFDCRQIAVRHPGARRKRERSSYPDLLVRVKVRPGHAGPVIFDAALEGEIELIAGESLLKFEDGIRRTRRRVFWAKVWAGAAVLAVIAWGLHRLGAF